MVTILASMWATAFAQAIIPWFVFWPLFIFTQFCIWTAIFIGLGVRLMRSAGASIDERRYNAWHAKHGEAWMKMQPNESLEAYKIRILG